MNIEGTFLLENGFYKGSITVSDGHIQGIDADIRVEEADEIIVPGFVDIHVHGGGGADTMDGTVEAFRTIAETGARYGTTALLLTTMTESPSRIEGVLREFQTNRSSLTTGAEIVGVHLEGPFINPKFAGAQRADMIRDPDVGLLTDWLNYGVVRMVTMAPERTGALEFIKLCHENGVVVAVGHSDAEYDDLCHAVEAGLSHMTHLCNAMRPLHHRSPGVLCFALTHDSLTADYISDGIHVHPAVIQLIQNAKGLDRLMLITDGMRAVGMRDGTYDLGGQNVTVRDQQARLDDNTLAGSVLTTKDAFFNAVKFTGLKWQQASQLLSANPAKRLGLNKGKLEVGYDADLAVLRVSSKDVIATMVKGEWVYKQW